MRIAFYNQMFGLDGRSLLSNLLGHYRVHFKKDSPVLWKMINLKRTIEMVKQSRADIIGVAEVLQGQEKELERGLKRLGYKYFHFGEGHKTRFRSLQIKVMIASKVKCNKEYIPREPIENKLGGGGGFIDCYLPSKKMNIMCVHLGMKPVLRKRQISFLRNHLKKKERFVLIGDFNCKYENLPKLNLSLLSNQIPTCSLTPLLHNFFWEDCDHIFARKVIRDKFGFLEGSSDHRLIYVDLK